MSAWDSHVSDEATKAQRRKIIVPKVPKSRCVKVKV